MAGSRASASAPVRTRPAAEMDAPIDYGRRVFVLRSGLPWRMMPRDLPPVSTAPPLTRDPFSSPPSKTLHTCHCQRQWRLVASGSLYLLRESGIEALTVRRSHQTIARGQSLEINLSLFLNGDVA